MRVRKATHDDIPWITGQLKDFAAFFGMTQSLYPDDVAASAGVADMVERHLVLIAADDEGERLGLIAGLFHPHPYNAKLKYLTETFWWVDPSRRRSLAGAALIDEFVIYGREHADVVVMSLLANSPVNDETLEKRGFKLKERSFVLEVR